MHEDSQDANQHSYLDNPILKTKTYICHAFYQLQPKRLHKKPQT